VLQRARGKDPDQVFHGAATDAYNLHEVGDGGDCVGDANAGTTLTLIDNFITSYFNPDTVSSSAGNCCALPDEGICEIGPDVTETTCGDAGGSFLANGACQADGSCAAP
jgi:hypothetical protein